MVEDKQFVVDRNTVDKIRIRYEINDRNTVFDWCEENGYRVTRSGPVRGQKLGLITAERVVKEHGRKTITI